jgi:hypothetical protein
MLGRAELAIELLPKPTDLRATVTTIHNHYSRVLNPILTAKTWGSMVL